MSNNTFERYVGTTLADRYQIEKLVGTGGMSVVFRAFDTVENRQVAIKMLRDEIANDKEALHRFVNESRAIAMLSHPNIVGIYDVSIETDVKYLVMEYVEGISLRTYMDKRGALTFDEVVSYSEQILAALTHAHEKGIVHRDIKPQNIMLLKDGIVKVTDFGIAKLPDSETATISDKAIGTVYYISPEQAAGKRSDARADLYSLGVMMYEMSTGKLPFDDDRPISVVMMQIHDKPVPPRQISKEIPRGMETLILSAMEKDPKHRYQSALDMFRELRKLKRNPSAAVLTPQKVASAKRSNKNRKENPTSHSVTPVILGIAFAILFVAIVAGFYSLDKLNIGGIVKESIEVPSVVGMKYTNKEDLGLNDNFTLTVNYEYSSSVQKDEIISQLPIAGSSRKPVCNVTITVSKGPQLVVVGDHTMKDWRIVQSTLRSLGFVVAIRNEENAAIPSGYVIRTEPATGTSVEVGSPIIIYVSKGAAQELVTVPNFVGMTEPLAVETMKNSKLTLGDVIYTRSSQPAGTILQHTPAESEQIYSGSSVDFIVSGGPGFSANYCPSVVSMTDTDAITVLNFFGLEVNKKYVADSAEKGTVLSQDPMPDADGSLPPSTTEVVITVSGGSEYLPPKISVPSITGQTLTVAKKLLEWSFNLDDVDFTIDVKYVISNEKKDTVLSQSPAAGPIVGFSNIRVVLVVSGGPDYIPPDVTVTVPSVIELTLNEARPILEENGISVGKVTYVADSAPAGFIIGQSEEENSEITGPEGLITLDLIISGGADYTETTSSDTTVPEPEISTEPSGPVD